MAVQASPPSRTPAAFWRARRRVLPRIVLWSIICLLPLMPGSILAPGSAEAQASEQTESLREEVRDRLAEGRQAVRDLLARPATGPILLGLLAVWIAWYVPRLLRRGAGQGGPSRGMARRLSRRGDHVEAGRMYERLGDWAAAADAYEQGRAFGEAARIWEHQNQPAKAARLYEQANEYLRAGELYARGGNHLRAATLFQKGGRDVQAAEAAERAGDLERAASLYVKFDAFDRAGELRFQMRQYAQAAELLERALGRLRRGAQESGVSAATVQALARRCAEAYARAEQPARAAAVLRDHGMEVEAAEQYCKAGEWDTGLALFVRHQQFDRAAQLCEELGRAPELHAVLGERLLAEGREEDAAREFEAGEQWWRAGEMYQRIREHGKAAEMFARHGDEERAAEMYVAAGDPRRAARALERIGRRAEAAQYYQQAGDRRDAARVLQEAGDAFGAARELLAADAGEEAMALLQQVEPESEQYGEACVLLGDLFLERGLDGPAREKYERAAALRPSGPDSVYPTYQLAAMHERQGNLQEALRLFEKVVAEHLDYRDVQERVTTLWDRLAATTQLLGGRDTASGSPPAASARYRVSAEIGRGGMGIVYRAEDVVLQRPVAYKVLPDAVRDDAKALEDFLREARIAASLHHPNIVTIYDAGVEADAVYIAMEYVEGRSLQEMLVDPTPLPLRQALEVFRQACRSLVHAHRQQVVHRDVKPANIMVTRDGTVKLMDFGLAAVVSQAGARVTSVRGTPFYMAPEQIMGEAISAFSDQYSLGCTCYHMVAGRPPFIEGDILYHHIHTEPVSPRQWNPRIPVWLDAIILRTMVKTPTKRFPSVEVVLHEIERCLAAPGSAAALGDPAR